PRSRSNHAIHTTNSVGKTSARHAPSILLARAFSAFSNRPGHDAHGVCFAQCFSAAGCGHLGCGTSKRATDSGQPGAGHHGRSEESIAVGRGAFGAAGVTIDNP